VKIDETNGLKRTVRDGVKSVTLRVLSRVQHEF